MFIGLRRVACHLPTGTLYLALVRLRSAPYRDPYNSDLYVSVMAVRRPVSYTGYRGKRNTGWGPEDTARGPWEDIASPDDKIIIAQQVSLRTLCYRRSFLCVNGDWLLDTFYYVESSPM